MSYNPYEMKKAKEVVAWGSAPEMPKFDGKKWTMAFDEGGAVRRMSFLSDDMAEYFTDSHLGPGAFTHLSDKTSFSTMAPMVGPPSCGIPCSSLCFENNLGAGGAA